MLHHHGLSQGGLWILWVLSILHLVRGTSSFLVATEYYTKWAKAISLKISIQKHIISFIKEYIIGRFCIPQRLIMDNGTNFIGKDIKEFYKNMKIDQWFFSIYYP